MTALHAVATYLPQQRVPIEDLAGQLGLTPMQVQLFKRFHGLAEVRMAPDQTLAGLLLSAVAQLGTLASDAHRVRYVLHARSVPVVAPYPVNPLHEVCHSLGLEHAAAFTVTHHACASGLLAVDVAGRLLAGDGDPDALALILAGEKTFTLDARLVPETSIFGEGAAACLVGYRGDRDRLLSYAVSVRGEFGGRLAESPDLMDAYQREYPESLAAVIAAAVEAAGVCLAEISLILPHNVNTVSWRRLCRKIGFPAGRVLLDNVPVTGHVFCADMFLNYRTAVDQGRLQPGDRYLIAAAGAGATFSAMVFEH
jgi:3-oxoacyl-[acyl-carrier-protein] synthase-3